MEEKLETKWKEWISLEELTKKIPQQFQIGLNRSQLNITCLHAFHDHLVIGTNAGLLYLTPLSRYNLIKLKCENVVTCIQTVASVSSVDDLIAGGCLKGSVTIFQIPAIRSLNAALALSQECGPVNKKTPAVASLKRFTLNIHNNTITSLVWSRNGMRLFSGDLDGYIGLTELDYESTECTGRVLFKVDSRVVQLSYAHQRLAVAYQDRCLIYNCQNGIKVFVGKKPCNPPGLYGCTFASSQDVPREDILYCARSGQKIWFANNEGEVLFSYIQKKLHEHCLIKLLNIPKFNQRIAKLSFGYLLHYKESILVSYSENCLIILNVDTKKVLGYCEDFHRICDVAISDDNIYVLDNFRKIICISQHPPSFEVTQTPHLLTSSLHIPSQQNLNISSLAEITTKIKPILPKKQFIDGIAKLGETVASKLSDMANPSVVYGNKFFGEEKIYSNLASNYTSTNDGLSNRVKYAPRPSNFAGMSHFPYYARVNASKEDNKEHEVESEIRNQENSLEGKEDNAASQDKRQLSSLSGSHQNLVLSPVVTKKKTKIKTDLNEKAVNIKKNGNIENKMFISDSRTYEDFKDTIETNENLLADVLNISCLRMDHEKTIELTECKSEFDCDPPSTPSLLLEEKGYSLQICSSSPTDKLENTFLKDLSYGPPSGSSTCLSSLDEHAKLVTATSNTNVTSEVNLLSGIFIEKPVQQDLNTLLPPEDRQWNWQKHHLPVKPHVMLGHRQTLYLSELKDLYYSNDFCPKNKNLPSWNKRHIVETASFSSFNKDLLLLTTDGSLLSINHDSLLSNASFSSNFLMEDKEIACVSADQNTLWTLSKYGKVVARYYEEEKEKLVEVSCQELRLKKVICRAGVVWGLTNNGRIAYRIGIRPTMLAGIEWGIMLHKSPVQCIHISENGLGWMMDSEGALYVCLYLSQSYPQGLDGKWWQIGTSDCMLEEICEQDKMPEISLTSNEHYLWIFSKDSPFAYNHSLHSFVGHRWECLGPNIFTSICGEGIFRSNGALYCTNSSGHLFVLNPQTRTVVPIDLPPREKLASFSARPESLWLLTESGKIFIRTQLSGSKYLGLKWARLSIHQIADIRLKHISLSTGVVWAVDTNGQVYMRQGPLIPLNPKGKGLDPAWIHVDSNELKNGAVFVKVHVGNRSGLVWGLDSAHRVYVREAIFPDFPTGTSWVLVPGILAQSLSISDDRVFVVTQIHKDSSGEESAGGLLFVREGITSCNYIGDYWKRIPSNSIPFTDVTVSVDNRVWTLDNKGKAFEHISLSLYNVGLEGRLPPCTDDDILGSDAEDWEIV